MAHFTSFIEGIALPPRPLSPASQCKSAGDRVDP